MHNKNEKELKDLYLKSVGAVYLYSNLLSEKNAALEQFLTDFEDSNYVEDFEEGYAENFEEERNVEIFKKENTLSDCFVKKYPIPSHSDRIYYAKPVFGESEHP